MSRAHHTSFYPGTTQTKTNNPNHRFVLVKVKMPHIAKYGRSVEMSLVYGVNFPVAVGDLVRCPPTRLNSKWSTGRVTKLDPKGYKGRVKYLAEVKHRR